LTGGVEKAIWESPVGGRMAQRSEDGRGEDLFGRSTKTEPLIGSLADTVIS